VGFDGRKSEPLVEARVAAVKSFQIAVGVSFISLCERRLDEARTDIVALPLRFCRADPSPTGTQSIVRHILWRLLV